MKKYDIENLAKWHWTKVWGILIALEMLIRIMLSSLHRILTLWNPLLLLPDLLPDSRVLSEILGIVYEGETGYFQSEFQGTNSA